MHALTRYFHIYIFLFVPRFPSQLMLPLFLKHMEVPTITDVDYRAYLQDSKWTLELTNHLMDLARQFDVRFIHMHDRWDVDRFPPRPSIEEMKARYYGILGTLDKVRRFLIGSFVFFLEGIQLNMEISRRIFILFNLV